MPLFTLHLSEAYFFLLTLKVVIDYRKDHFYLHSDTFLWQARYQIPEHKQLTISCQGRREAFRVANPDKNDPASGQRFTFY